MWFLNVGSGTKINKVTFDGEKAVIAKAYVDGNGIEDGGLDISRGQQFNLRSVTLRI